MGMRRAQDVFHMTNIAWVKDLSVSAVISRGYSKPGAVRAHLAVSGNGRSGSDRHQLE